jgi:mannose/cellobiose epimerase-like protein (N-acyl-D-glucosamine 2-epimerase family)
LLQDAVETGWHPEGGWIHLWNPDGTVKDPQRDTYDQCFVLLALAWLWRATKWPEARVWAERTIAYMDDHLVDRANGGFYESSLRLDYRRANPHMHYLEAMQAWYEVTGERAFLDRAQTRWSCSQSVFFDPESWSVTEHFERDWSVRTDKPARSSLGTTMNGSGCCCARRALPDQPELKEYCRKLYATSHAFGHARGTDAVCDSMAPDGSEMIGTARLWCQTEALKAGLWRARTACPATRPCSSGCSM